MTGAAAGMRDKDAKAAEFREAAARERERADAAQAKVAALQDQLSSAEADAAEAARLKSALRQEKERAAAAAGELEKAKAQFASLQTVGTQAAELKAALEQEKERSAAHARDLRNAGEQLAALKAGDAKRAEAARELEAAKAELARLKATETRAAQLQDALNREKERADAALRDLSAVSAQLASVRSEAEADRTAAIEPRKAPAPGESDDLKRVLSAAMTDYVAATGLREALAQEKARAQAMARQLEAAQTRLAALGSRTEFTPAALLFQSSMMLPRIPDNAEPGKTEEKPRKAPPRPAPSAALPSKPVEPSEPDRKPNAGPSQGSREQAKPEAPKPSTRVGRTSAGNADRISVTSEPRRSPPPPREVDIEPRARVLYLPPALQPIDEEWEFQ
jgi:hypothetical protein